MTTKSFILCCLSFFLIKESYAQWAGRYFSHFRYVNGLTFIDSVRAIGVGGYPEANFRCAYTTFDYNLNLWNVNLEADAQWLKAVAKLSYSKYIAVGDLGGIVKSVDESVTWNVISGLPSTMNTRDFNSVFFVDSMVGYIAGGRESQDSTQTILKTIDGGETWSVQHDNPGYCLNNIFFTAADTGFAVGDRGTILKTINGGSSWNVVPVSGNLSNRDFKQILFVNSTTGFMVGGNKMLDSTRTILKTTDGGNTWIILRDELGSMLNCIGFASASQVYVAGDLGTVLVSIDSGNTWTSMNFPISLTEGSDLNTISFWNEYYGLIAGKYGKVLRYYVRKPDAVTRSVSNVTATSTQLNGKVTANDIATYVEFEYGHTAALGSTVAIADSVYGEDTTVVSVTLSDLEPSAYYYFRVKATNLGGTTVGATKVFYTHENGNIVDVPYAETKAATNVLTTSVELNGTAVANYALTAVIFEYGLTPDLGNAMAVSDSLYGADSAEVSVLLTSLLPDHIYYFRVIAKNIAGNDTGEIKSFYTYSGNCVIPNCDFEFWDTRTVEYPSGWMRMGNTRVITSYNGSKAIEMSDTPYFKDGGLLIYARPNGEGFDLIMPLSSLPDSIVFWAKYDVVPGDTVTGAALFARNHELLYAELVFLTGSSGGNWERISRPINYSNAEIPDSATVAFTNQKIMFGGNEGDGTPGIYGSVLAVDDVKLTGIPEIIQNADFEQTETEAWQELSSWTTSDAESGRLQRTSDRVSGQYAVLLNNDTMYGTRMQTSNDYNIPGFAVGGRYTKFYFYTKFLRATADTMTAFVNMYKNGIPIGRGYATIDTAINRYTLIEVPIFYDGDPMETVVPDSASISISIDQHSVSGLGGASVAYIDNLSFEIVRPVDTSYSGVKEPYDLLPNLWCKIYPNPANDMLNVEYFKQTSAETVITVMDLQGRTVVSAIRKPQQDFVKSQISIADLAEGVYIVNVYDGIFKINRKLVIER